MKKTRIRIFIRHSVRIALCLFAYALTSTKLLAAEDQSTVTFTLTQAAAGQAGYEENCASCHGNALEGFGLVPSLTGTIFSNRWGDKSADQLANSVNRMPPGAEGSLDPMEYTQILAYVLEQNGMTAGESALPTNIVALAALTIPMSELSNAGAGLSAPLLYNSDGPLVSSIRLESLTAVTDDMLLNPPADDWLNWRRTRDAYGHSPLNQIDKENVEDLQLAWSWSLPQGENMMTPIVHDGVMFTYSYGDVLQAMDAATGELLWSFQRKLEAGKSPA